MMFVILGPRCAPAKVAATPKTMVYVAGERPRFEEREDDAWGENDWRPDVEVAEPPREQRRGAGVGQDREREGEVLHRERRPWHHQEDPGHIVEQ
jgi:hypothetical protein